MHLYIVLSLTSLLVTDIPKEIVQSGLTATQPTTSTWLQSLKQDYNPHKIYALRTTLEKIYPPDFEWESIITDDLGITDDDLLPDTLLECLIYGHNELLYQAQITLQ